MNYKVVVVVVMVFFFIIDQIIWKVAKKCTLFINSLEKLTLWRTLNESFRSC